MAWGTGELSGASMVAGGTFQTSPNYVHTPLFGDEVQCIENAESCSGIKYNSCCVPSLGKFTLALQWIPEKPINKFTIHGLWPGDCRSGQGPRNICDPSRDYAKGDFEKYIKNKPLLNTDLQKYMPSSGNDDFSFWKHEWSKHGTCISDIKPGCHNLKKGQDVVRYFKMTVELYKAYDVAKALEDARVYPDSKVTHTKQVFMNALKNWGNILTLHCVQNKIVEVRLNFLGKYGNKFIEDNNHGKVGNCSSTIIFPSKSRKVSTPAPVQVSVPVTNARNQPKKKN